LFDGNHGVELTHLTDGGHARVCATGWKYLYPLAEGFSERVFHHPFHRSQRLLAWRVLLLPSMKAEPFVTQYHSIPAT
jgi:hypothetical protein